MADTKVFLSGGRIQGRSDDALLTAIPQTSWKELGRTTLSSEGDTIDVSITGSVKTNLMLLVHLVQDSADTSNNPNFYYNFGKKMAYIYSWRQNWSQFKMYNVGI